MGILKMEIPKSAIGKAALKVLKGSLERELFEFDSLTVSFRGIAAPSSEAIERISDKLDRIGIDVSKVQAKFIDV